jgi:hypothetical protein
MGGNSSKNIVNITNEASAEAIMSSLQHCQSQSAQNQTVSGSFSFGISQTSSMSINVACTNSFQMSNDIALSMANAIQQKAEARGVALLDAVSRNRSENITTMSNLIKAKITTEMVQRAIAQAAQNQSVSSTVAIGVSQQMTADIAVKALTDMVNNTGLGIEIQNKSSQSATTESKNPLSFITDSIYVFLLFFAIIIGAIIAVVYFVFD